MEGRSIVFFPFIKTMDQFVFAAVHANATGTAVMRKEGESLGKSCRVDLREGNGGKIHVN